MALLVSDTGRGISATDLPHIFDRYYQAADVRHVSGTGIGLALVTTMAQLHKIEIEVESTPHVGTTFTLWLSLTPSYPHAVIETDAGKPHTQTYGNR